MAKWGSCDFSQIKKLQKQIDAVEKGKDTFCRQCANELAQRLIHLVKKRTPVITGDLRRSWTAGEIRQSGDVYEIEIINSKLYASYVEYGHRQEPGRFVPAIGKRLKKAWVPGLFMMTVSVQELQTMAPARLERMVAGYLKECLKDV